MSGTPMKYRGNPGARLWPRLRGDGECMVWTGAVNEHGYGTMTIDGRRWKSHRFAWALTHGSVPDDLDVCHHCDNPPCCNPDHLFLGTASDNGQDMARKGRHFTATRPDRIATGERHGMARLTRAQAMEIRRRGRSGESQLILATEYYVARRTVNSIVRGETWK